MDLKQIKLIQKNIKIEIILFYILIIDLICIISLSLFPDLLPGQIIPIIILIGSIILFFLFSIIINIHFKYSRLNFFVTEVIYEDITQKILISELAENVEYEVIINSEQKIWCELTKSNELILYFILTDYNLTKRVKITDLKLIFNTIDDLINLNENILFDNNFNYLQMNKNRLTSNLGEQQISINKRLLTKLKLLSKKS